jgi:hypothetical protein
MRDYRYFNFHPDVEYLNAMSALDKTDPSRVCAECLAKQRDERLAKDGYVPSHVGIQGLIDCIELAPPPPADDHGRLYVKNGRPQFYLSQPYGLSFENLKQIIQYCDEWGLEASIDGLQSNWYPGDTIAVLYQKKQISRTTT